MELVHGDRSVNVDLEDGRLRLIERSVVRKDTTKAYREMEEEELRSQVAGTVLEEKADEQF